VDGVGDQRQGVGRVAKDQLSYDEGRIEQRTGGKRRAETVRRMTVAGMVVRVGMTVIMIVMMVSHSGIAVA
jgi:hypothetical protein